MKAKIKAIIKRILFLPPLAIIIIVPIAATLVIFSLSNQGIVPVLEYFSYGLSAYALVVLILGFKRIISAVSGTVKNSRVYKWLESNKFMRLFLNDLNFKGKVSLYQGLAVSTIYAIFKGITALYYHSVWTGAVAAYYLFFGIVRIVLVRGTRKIETGNDIERLVAEYKSYCVCGVLTFLINIGMVGMTIMMIRDNEHAEYPGIIIYLSAAYTFYAFILAIMNLVKFRKAKSPILSASKALNFEAALMSMFSLQTALIAQFGEDDEVFRQIANTLMGSVVCVTTFGIAVFMIIKSCIKLKKLLKNKNP